MNKASTGIFYVIKSPGCWHLEYKRLDPDSDYGHVEFWADSVCRKAASIRSKYSGESFVGLCEDLHLLTYCYSRGRVVKLPSGEYAVLWGEDFPRQKLEGKILKAFGLCKTTKWLFDEHEQVQDLLLFACNARYED